MGSKNTSGLLNSARGHKKWGNMNMGGRSVDPKVTTLVNPSKGNLWGGGGGGGGKGKQSDIGGGAYDGEKGNGKRGLVGEGQRKEPNL